MIRQGYGFSVLIVKNHYGMRFLCGFVFCAVLCAACQPPGGIPPAAPLSDAAFASLIETVSEPGGEFGSDNLVSNETAYLHVVPKLRQLGVQGGVYLGVGPDQNFTYIAKIRPRYAFIIDIRRGNMLQHLLFKALFDMAETRHEYLSLLFSKPIQPRMPRTHAPVEAPEFSERTTIADLVAFFDRIPGDEAMYQENLQAVLKRLSSYGMDLSPEDLEAIAQIYRAFFTENLDLKFSYKTPSRARIRFPSYREFLLSTDLEGNHENFLNSDREFAFIKAMQAKNLIIPVTGDFAGPKALKEIAAYIKARGDRISAFYLSNVEFYLVPDGTMGAFAKNVAALPVDGRSVLIRAFVNTPSRTHPATVGNHLMTTVLQTVRAFNRLYAEGRYRTYWDVGTADYIH